MTQAKQGFILVIEDNDLDAELLRRIFQRLKPEVTLMRHEDGIDALEALKTCRPDLIIMDIRMPRMGGLETLELIKQDERLRSIPVIMMSSSKSQRDIADSYDRLANAYVVKAFDSKENSKIETLVRFWLDTAELDGQTPQQRTVTS